MKRSRTGQESACAVRLAPELPHRRKNSRSCSYSYSEFVLGSSIFSLIANRQSGEPPTGRGLASWGLGLGQKLSLRCENNRQFLQPASRPALAGGGEASPGSPATCRPLSAGKPSPPCRPLRPGVAPPVFRQSACGSASRCWARCARSRGGPDRTAARPRGRGQCRT